MSDIPLVINLFISLRSQVPSVAFCCQFLKSIILKAYNEIVLDFLLVESKTNIFYVNINFTGNFFFGLW